MLALRKTRKIVSLSNERISQTSPPPPRPHPVNSSDFSSSRKQTFASYYRASSRPAVLTNHFIKSWAKNMNNVFDKASTSAYILHFHPRSLAPSPPSPPHPSHPPLFCTPPFAIPPPSVSISLNFQQIICSTNLITFLMEHPWTTVAVIKTGKYCDVKVRDSKFGRRYFTCP